MNKRDVLLQWLLFCCAAFCGLVPSQARAAEWEMSVTENALVEIRHNGAPVVTTFAGVWAPNWSWAGPNVEVGKKLVEVTPFAMKTPDPDVQTDITGTINETALNVLRFDYEVATAKATTITGGGIIWNLALDSPSFAKKPADPVLWENKSGWKWRAMPLQTHAILSGTLSKWEYFCTGA